ncbi:unnamed protein product [Aphanomyces euteiches]
MAPLMMLVLAFLLSLSSVYNVENTLRRNKSKWIVPGLLGGMLSLSMLSAAVMISPDTFSYAQQALNGRGNMGPSSSFSKSTLELPAEEANMSRLGNVRNPTQEALEAAQRDWHPNVGLLPMPHNHSLGEANGLILNPGHEEKSLVVVLGDSHMEMLKPRFVRLCENTKPKDFPTIVFESMAYPPLVSCAWWTDILQVKIRGVRPHAVVYGINWLKYLRPSAVDSDPLHKTPSCCSDYGQDCLGQSRKDVQYILSRFEEDLSFLTMYGIKVFVNTICPEGPPYDPQRMANGTITSVNRTAFQEDHAWLLEQIERTIKAAKATVYDLSDNLCWDDDCHVVDSKGLPVRKDSNLLTSTFAANYLSVVDHIVAEATTSSNGTTASSEAPNSSRGPRIEEPTIPKIKAASSIWWPDQGYTQLTLDSNYASPLGTWRNTDAVMNLGQDKVVIAVGDSHSNQVKPRFLRLFNDRHGATNSSNFPTIVFKTLDGVPSLPCMNDYRPILDMIQRVRPNVVLHSMNWPQFLRPAGKDSDELVGNPRCCLSGYRDQCEYQRPKDVRALVNQLQDDLAKLTALGIKVFVATLNPEGKQFDPKNMLNGDDVGDVRPVLRSEFREEHKELTGLIEAAVAGANATLIDYSDNYCWQDVCQVIDDHGRPIMKDNNHLTSTFAYEYLSVVDQVIDAAMAD